MSITVDEAIDRNIKLIRMIASGYTRKAEDLDDLVQAGCLGVVEQWPKYNPCDGIEVSTFVGNAARWKMQRHCSLKTKPIGSAGHTVSNRIKTAERRLGIKLTDENVALFKQDLDQRYKLKTSEENIKCVLRARAGHTVHLDSPIGEDDTSYHDVISGPSVTAQNNPEQLLIYSEIEDRIHRILERRRASDRDIAIICGLYGVGRDKMTGAELARSFGVKRQTINQIDNKFKPYLLSGLSDYA